VGDTAKEEERSCEREDLRQQREEAAGVWAGLFCALSCAWLLSEIARVLHSTDYCDCCGDRGPQATRFVCGGCLESKYCSKECQELNWRDHKGLCLQIKAEREAREKRKQLGEALVDASDRGDLPEVRRLLALGADARYKVEDGKYKGYFPLVAASVNGLVVVIEALVAGGADPNQVEPKMTLSSLYTAAQFN
jgi:hypothetical protein